MQFWTTKKRVNFFSRKKDQTGGVRGGFGKRLFTFFCRHPSLNWFVDYKIPRVEGSYGTNDNNAAQKKTVCCPCDYDRNQAICQIMIHHKFLIISWHSCIPVLSFISVHAFRSCFRRNRLRMFSWFFSSPWFVVWMWYDVWMWAHLGHIFAEF